MAKENKYSLTIWKKILELNHIQVRQWWCAINSEAYCRQKTLPKAALWTLGEG